jgi:hypothetical protein
MVGLGIGEILILGAIFVGGGVAALVVISLLLTKNNQQK